MKTATPLISGLTLCALLLCAPLPAPCPARAETLSPEAMAAAPDAETLDEAPDALNSTVAPAEPDASDAQTSEARERMIDGILAQAKQLFDDARGRAQRAHYSGDIYICKNFTVYLFNAVADGYRMAEYPGVPLRIPDNLPADECKPYSYGVAWQDMSAAEGNPFVVAASFRYDSALSDAENRELARAFLQKAQRGDYFQMAANYYYGVGAHSMVFIADYDPQTDSVRWTDSNMKGEKRNGERYAYVQYDAVREIDWFVDAFCRKNYGATIYRLRDDIVYAE